MLHFLGIFVLHDQYCLHRLFEIFPVYFYYSSQSYCLLLMKLFQGPMYNCDSSNSRTALRKSVILAFLEKPRIFRYQKLQSLWRDHYDYQRWNEGQLNSGVPSEYAKYSVNALGYQKNIFLKKLFPLKPKIQNSYSLLYEISTLDCHY